MNVQDDAARLKVITDRNEVIQRLRQAYQQQHEMLVATKQAYDTLDLTILPTDVLDMVKAIDLAPLEPIERFLRHVAARVDN